jgi:hypothetical protein
MKSQTPAEGILKTNDFGNAKYYKVVCGCGQPDHDLDFEVEADETGVNVNTYVSAKTDYWTDAVKKRYDIDNPWLQEFDWFWKDIFNGFVTRLKLTWTVWTKGYIRCESTIAMSEQQALNYAATLESAIKDVKAFRFKENKNQEVEQVLKTANEQDCV